MSTAEAVPAAPRNDCGSISVRRWLRACSWSGPTRSRLSWASTPGRLPQEAYELQMASASTFEDLLTPPEVVESATRSASSCRSDPLRSPRGQVRQGSGSHRPGLDIVEQCPARRSRAPASRGLDRYRHRAGGRDRGRRPTLRRRSCGDRSICMLRQPRAAVRRRPWVYGRAAQRAAGCAGPAGTGLDAVPQAAHGRGVRCLRPPASRRERRFGAALGDGWYRGRLGWSQIRAHYGRSLALLAQLELTLDDSSVLRVVTDSEWTASTGEIHSADLYDGTVTDLTRAQPGWDSPGFDDVGWGPVRGR